MSRLAPNCHTFATTPATLAVYSCQRSGAASSHWEPATHQVPASLRRALLHSPLLS